MNKTITIDLSLEEAYLLLYELTRDSAFRVKLAEECSDPKHKDELIRTARILRDIERLLTFTIELEVNTKEGEDSEYKRWREAFIKEHKKQVTEEI